MKLKYNGTQFDLENATVECSKCGTLLKIECAFKGLVSANCDCYSDVIARTKGQKYAFLIPRKIGECLEDD